MTVMNLLMGEGVRLINERLSHLLASPMMVLTRPAALAALPLLALCAWIGIGVPPNLELIGTFDLAHTLLIAGVILASMLLHELLHLAAFFRCGGRSGSVRIKLRHGWLPIAFANMDLERAPDWQLLAVVSTSGPLLAFSAALLANLAVAPDSWIHIATYFAALSAIVNLLPLPGSDGAMLVVALRARLSRMSHVQLEAGCP